MLSEEKRIEKFWNRINIKNDNECWNWLGTRDKEGYGVLRHNYKYKKAHRYCWELVYGEIPEEMLVMHRCDNPSCCNPLHLMIGTHLDNAHDREAKGRGRKKEGDYRVEGRDLL